MDIPPAIKKEFLGLPNYLTYLRIVSVVVILFLMSAIDPERDPYPSNVFVSWVTMIFFVIVQISDGIDGWIARKYQMTSSFGNYIDPLADKLLSTAVLVMLIPLGRIAPWMVVVLISREMGITALRSIAVSEGVAMKTSQWGKQKTFLQSFALGFLLVHYKFSGINPQLVGTVLIWMTILISLGSGLHYSWRTFNEILRKKYG